MENHRSSSNSTHGTVQWSLSEELDRMAASEKALGGMTKWRSELASQSRLTECPNVLSFDCGMKNLSYCLVEDTTDSVSKEKSKAEIAIVIWAKVDLKATDIQRACENMVRHFDSRAWMIRADEVVVEGQVPQNMAMKALSHGIQVYFITRTTTMYMTELSMHEQRQERKLSASKRMPFEFIRPGAKFDALPGSVTQEYESANRAREEEALKKKKGRQRLSDETPKEKAVRLCAIILKQRFGTESNEYHFFVQNWVKADDLADCFLQAHYKIIVNRERRKKRKNIKAFIMVNLDDDASTVASSATSFAHHNNESMMRLADAEMDSHIVFYAPQYREHIFDLREIEFARARKIHKVLYEDLACDHGVVDVEFVGVAPSSAQLESMLISESDSESCVLVDEASLS